MNDFESQYEKERLAKAKHYHAELRILAAQLKELMDAAIQDGMLINFKAQTKRSSWHELYSAIEIGVADADGAPFQFGIC